MTQNSFAANALEALLSWFESLVNSVWTLLSGSNGGTLLRWISKNWIPLLLFFLIVGVVMDVFIYLLRWRPFWYWFRKKRMVVDDRALEPRRSGAKARPSTYVPVQNRRYGDGEDDDVFGEEKQLFMDPSLFDVKPRARKAASDDLYVHETDSRAHGAKPKKS